MTHVYYTLNPIKSNNRNKKILKKKRIMLINDQKGRILYFENKFIIYLLSIFQKLSLTELNLPICP